MRILLAILYIVLGMVLYFQYAFDPTFALGITLLSLLLLSSLLLFNPGLLRRLRGQSYEQYLASLEAQGKLEHASYHVSRAFHYEDLGNGRSAYFLEVDHHGVLCLYGQYLRTYASGTGPGHPREFPTRTLTLHRLKKNQALLEMHPEGETFEPTVIAQPSPEILRELNIQPRDGQLCTHIGYDELLSQLASHPLAPLHS